MTVIKTEEAEIVRVRDLSPSVREMVLSPSRPVVYKPGQWLSVHLPIGQKPPLVRAYSVAEPPSPSGELVLVFDRVPGGVGSGYLFSLKPGDRLALAGIFGRFLTPDPLNQNLLLIGRYTGIVPIRCIIKDLFHSHRTSPKGNPENVILIYSMPTLKDLLYHEEFVQLAGRTNRFWYIPIVSKEAPGKPDFRAEIETIAFLLKGGVKKYFPMISGVKAFVHPIRQFFMDQGLGRKEMRQEIYD